MVASDRLERVPLVGGLAAGDGASRHRQPRAAAGFVAGLVALAAVVALATGADAPARALASLGKASGASKGEGSTCESRVRAATADATFYAFDLFAWSPFSARGDSEYTLDPPEATDRPPAGVQAFFSDAPSANNVPRPDGSGGSGRSGGSRSGRYEPLDELEDLVASVGLHEAVACLRSALGRVAGDDVPPLVARDGSCAGALRPDERELRGSMLSG